LTPDTSAQSAIDINPSFALGHLSLGMARLFDGDAQHAIAPLEHGPTLNPNDPQKRTLPSTRAILLYEHTP
jgi:hypothetical protein